jgi:hypothetical protein
VVVLFVLKRIKVKKVIKMENKSDNGFYGLHRTNSKSKVDKVLDGTKFESKLSDEEYKFVGFFLENFLTFLEIYIEKDRQYDHAWRNMPWQSCILRAREKMARLLAMPNAKLDDLLEECGDSIMYNLSALYQMPNGVELDATSKKSKMIEYYLDKISEVLKTDEDKIFLIGKGIQRVGNFLTDGEGKIIGKVGEGIMFDSIKFGGKDEKP